MNQLRHFLSRGGVARQCVLFIVFTVMLSRALLSSAVMLDADAPAGSFGLVMCSGHGPMFPQTEQSASDASMRMDGAGDMNMAGMDMRPVGASRSVDASTNASTNTSAFNAMHRANRTDAINVIDAMMTTHQNASDPMHMDDAQDDNNLCPFSAAFLAAITLAAFVALLFGLVLSGRSWKIVQECLFIRLAPYSRPRSRAPPLYV